MLALLGIPLGILLLIVGGAALVAGASQIAERFGVSPMIIGLTIVGFGTSAPELVITLVGALRGETALAFGMGAAAMFRAIDIQGDLVKREIPLLLLVTMIITVMALDNVLEGSSPAIGRSDSIILFLLFGIFLEISG